MKKGVILLCVLALCFAVSFSGASDVAAASGKPVKLKFAAFFPASTTLGRACQKLLDLVEERSGGKVKFDTYWSSSLLSHDKMLDGLSQDIVDVSYVVTIFEPKTLALSRAAGIFGVTYNAWAGMMAWREFTQLAPIKKEWQKQNALPVWPACFFPNTILAKKPVRSIEDLKGMRILAQGEQVPNIVKDLGGVPVTMLSPEVYDALSKGALDGLFYAVEYYHLYGWIDVCKYWMPDSNIGGITYSIAWNKRTFDKLPKDVQKIIVDLGESGESVDIFYDMVHSQPLNKFINQDMPKQGVELVRWPKKDSEKLKKITEAHVDVWYKDMVKKGYPVAKDLFFKWQKLNSKYDALYPAKRKKMGWTEVEIQ